MLPSPIHHGLHSDNGGNIDSVDIVRLPSPIHHGLHSDTMKSIQNGMMKIVAIPYSSRVAFGLITTEEMQSL